MQFNRAKRWTALCCCASLLLTFAIAGSAQGGDTYPPLTVKPQWAGTVVPGSPGPVNPGQSLGAPDYWTTDFVAPGAHASYADFGLGGGTDHDEAMFAGMLGISVDELRQADFVAFEINGNPIVPFEASTWVFSSGGVEETYDVSTAFRSGIIQVPAYRAVFVLGMPPAYFDEHVFPYVLFDLDEVDPFAADFEVIVMSDGGFRETPDVDAMGVLMRDCNDNGISDGTDIENGDSLDCLSSGIPDECELVSAECPFQFGDVSNNGVIDASDVILFTSVLLGLNQCGCGVEAADMNQDGVVSLRDVQPFVATIECNAGLDPSPRSLNPATNLSNLAQRMGVELDLAVLIGDLGPAGASTSTERLTP